MKQLLLALSQNTTTNHLFALIGIFVLVMICLWAIVSILTGSPEVAATVNETVELQSLLFQFESGQLSYQKTFP